MFTRSLLLILSGVLVGCLVLLGASYVGKGIAASRPMLGARDQAAYDAAQAVLRGGYVLHFRHAERQKWPAVIAFDVYEAATGAGAEHASYRDAVCLTPQGEEEAKMIGAIFDLADAPVGPVIASPSCRAQQTAELAFGRIDRTEVALLHTPAFNVANGPVFATALRDLYKSIEFSASTNAVIIAHTNTLEFHPEMFVSGAEWLDIAQLGETGFYVIARSPEGDLSILYRFNTLGDFAANAISLAP